MDAYIIGANIYEAMKAMPIGKTPNLDKMLFVFYLLFHDKKPSLS